MTPYQRQRTCIAVRTKVRARQAVSASSRLRWRPKTKNWPQCARRGLKIRCRCRVNCCRWCASRIQETGINRGRVKMPRQEEKPEIKPIRLMGRPTSPFWECPHCGALSRTCISFEHKLDCIVVNGVDALNDTKHAA